MRFIRIPAALIAALILVPAVLPRAEGQSPTMPGYPAVGSPATVTLLAPGCGAALAAALQGRQRLQGHHGHDDGDRDEHERRRHGDADGRAADRMSATIDVIDVAANGDITFNLAFTKMSFGSGGNPMMAAAYGSRGRQHHDR